MNVIPDAELVAVCDIRSPEECNFLNQKASFFRSFEELLAVNQNPDVINICTPNGLHSEMAIAALKNNLHVVVEKPLALKKSDAEKIISQSQEVNKHVFCVMQNRYSPPSVWLKRILSEKKLGRVFIVQINCYWNRDERYYSKGGWHGTADLDGGTLFTQFSHFIDMLFWLFGDIKDITGRFFDFNHSELTAFEDSGMVSFEFDQGGSGSINYSTSVYEENLESSLTVIGEKGTVKIGGQYMNEVVYCNINDYDMEKLPPSNPPNDYGIYKGSAQNHNFVIQNVIDKIISDIPITTNAFQGMKVVEIIERIYAVRDKETIK